MPIWLLVVILCVATHRVTRLITRDAFPIIARPREAFGDRWASFADAKTREDRKKTVSGKTTNIFMASVAYLWECDWCVSVWVATGLTTAAYFTTPLADQHWFVSVLVGLTASSVTGLTAQREPE
jgi:hypothetical protein